MISVAVKALVSRFSEIRRGGLPERVGEEESGDSSSLFYG